jgi:hypothetical protein
MVDKKIYNDALNEIEQQLDVIGARALPDEDDGFSEEVQELIDLVRTRYSLPRPDEDDDDVALDFGGYEDDTDESATSINDDIVVGED